MSEQIILNIPIHSGVTSTLAILQLRIKSQQHWNIISPLMPTTKKNMSLNLKYQEVQSSITFESVTTLKVQN